MAKFIRIKDSLINVDKVTNFELSVEEIWVFFDDGSNPLNIFCANEHEAKLIFEDIPHLIDNNYIPESVRQNVIFRLERENECYRRAIPEDAQRFWNDSDYGTLPF